MKKPIIVHVNRAIIAFNAKKGTNLPVYTVKENGLTTYGHGVRFTGPSECVDPRERKQLSCGARAWMETSHPVVITDPVTWDEVMEMKAAAE